MNTLKNFAKSAFAHTSAKFKYFTKRYKLTESSDHAYQAFYGLNHYNLLGVASFYIKKLNQPTNCFMLQFKGKCTLKTTI